MHCKGALVAVCERASGADARGSMRVQTPSRHRNGSMPRLDCDIFFVRLHACARPAGPPKATSHCNRLTCSAASRSSAAGVQSAGVLSSC